MTEPSALVLSPDEIYAITHYKRPKEQLAALRAMGIPAHLRNVDHTVCVLRAHVTNPSSAPATNAPGPQLKSIRRQNAKASGGYDGGY